MHMITISSYNNKTLQPQSYVWETIMNLTLNNNRLFMLMKLQIINKVVNTPGPYISPTLKR